MRPLTEAQPAPPAAGGGRETGRAEPPAAAAGLGAATPPLSPDRGRLGRRAGVDPRRLAPGPRRDRHGLPRAGVARPAGRRRRDASTRERSASISTAPSSSSGSRPRRRRSPSTPRNPAHDLAIGGDHVAFGSVASAPNVLRLTAGGGSATGPTTRTSSASLQMLNVVHFFAGYPVEPIDIHPSVRHLYADLRPA